jgi:hypothetical protein
MDFKWTIICVVVFFSTIIDSHSQSLDSLDMKIYCSKTSGVSFPATGVGEDFNYKPGNPGYDETYSYKDEKNLIFYQFFLKRIDKQSEWSNKYYLDQVATEKVKIIGAKFIGKKIYENDGRQIIDYSYEYYVDGVKKTSFTRTAIEGVLYYSWSVQTYRGYGSFSSKDIFHSFVSYVGDTGNCN